MPISSEYRPALTVAGVDTRIELDGWAAGAPFTLDAHGTQWELGTDSFPGGIDGWQDGPGVRLSQDPRPGEHGVFDGPALLSERVITITGSARSPDFASSQRARDILTSIAGDSLLGLTTLVVYEAGRPTRQAAVRRAAESKTLWLSDFFFQWSMILVAPDSRRYANAQSSQFVSLPGSGSGGLVFPLTFPLTFGTGAAGGEMALTNSGTIATPTVYAIRAPVTTPVITNVGSGQRLEFAAGFAVDTGEPDVVIDTDAKTVLQGGVNRRADLVVAQWWSLEPGVTQVRFSGASADPATARLTGTWRDAWS